MRNYQMTESNSDIPTEELMMCTLPFPQMLWLKTEINT